MQNISEIDQVKRRTRPGAVIKKLSFFFTPKPPTKCTESNEEIICARLVQIIESFVNTCHSICHANLVHEWVCNSGKHLYRFWKLDTLYTANFKNSAPNILYIFCKVLVWKAPNIYPTASTAIAGGRNWPSANVFKMASIHHLTRKFDRFKRLTADSAHSLE